MQEEASGSTRAQVIRDEESTVTPPFEDSYLTERIEHDPNGSLVYLIASPSRKPLAGNLSPWQVSQVA